MCEAYAEQYTQTTEPQVTVWSSDTCGGTKKSLPIGEYMVLSQYVPFAIKAFWVPPHIDIITYESGINGTWDYASAKSYGPGVYVASHPIGAMVVNKNEDWNKFVWQCCKGINGEYSSEESCRGLWRTNSEQKTGSCDNLMLNYCEKNPEDELCSCVKQVDTSDMDYLSKAMAEMPLCYSRQCVLKGYKPSTSAKYECPPLHVCVQDMSTVGASNLLQDNVIMQDCSSTSTTTVTANTTTTSETDNSVTNIAENKATAPDTMADKYVQIEAAKTASEAAENKQLTEKWVTLIVVAVLAVIIIAGLLFFLFRKKKSSVESKETPDNINSDKDESYVSAEISDTPQSSAR